jgi:hypothetical protein
LCGVASLQRLDNPVTKILGGWFHTPNYARKVPDRQLQPALSANRLPSVPEHSKIAPPCIAWKKTATPARRMDIASSQGSLCRCRPVAYEVMGHPATHTTSPTLPVVLALVDGQSSASHNVISASITSC